MTPGAHPARLTILDILPREGPASATELAPRLGISPSAASWHLRHLAGFGLVRDGEPHPDGRARRWEAAARGFGFSTVNYGVRPLGALVGGGLAAVIGLRATLLVAAVGGAMSVFWTLASPVVRIRSLDRDLTAVSRLRLPSLPAAQPTRFNEDSAAPRTS